MTEHYQELYKKYRPRTWDDIIGQDTVVASLRQAPITGKIPTGYMFFGGHGCGKTSSALILAKSLNCSNLQENGNPCNECPTCIAIDKQTQIGVQYISMANRGSAEDVRKIVQEAQLAQPIKHQVWILDECHRLSGPAFDALLIPLESEKTKSLFIFCSTEPEKIPKTILSRLQTRTFNPVDPKTLAKNLKHIVDSEGLDVSVEDIIRAARSANGSVRDSIRNLETLITDGELPEQYSEKVLRLANTTKFTDVFALTNEMIAQGQSFTETAQRLYTDLSSVLILMSGGIPVVTYPVMEELASAVPPALIIRYLDILGNSIDAMSRNTVDSRVLFDIALTKMVTLRRKLEGRK